MLIDLIDPNDETIRGALVSTGPIVPANVSAGAFVTFRISESDSSHDVRELFNLSAPPSFPGPFQVWGEFYAATSQLVLFLAPETGDRHFRFALLNGFSFAPHGHVLNGTGELFRKKKLPMGIKWRISS